MIKIIEGDITKVTVDAIVNPSNTSLILGAGVSGAIAKVGGPSIQEEMSAIGHCGVGAAVITGAGNLPCKYVIHTVGPRMGEGDENEKLRRATYSSLACAEKFSMESIAFPAISTGIFGFPVEQCAKIMLAETIAHFGQADRSLTEVIFCLFGKEAFNTFTDTLKNISG